jgi:WD40 repeat protein
MNSPEIYQVVFSADGRFLATATRSYVNSKDNMVRIWEVATGKELHRLVHENYITAVAFSADGKALATASVDAFNKKNYMARIWEIATGKELYRLAHGDWVTDVSFSPDGKFLATASADGAARLWHWQPMDLIAQACGFLTRNFSWEEWRQYFENEPYRKTCENLPVHPSLFEAAQMLADEGQSDGAIGMIQQINKADPSLHLDPQAELKKWENKLWKGSSRKEWEIDLRVS